MTPEEAIVVFSSFSPEEKKEFLAHLMYELTVVARDNYEVGQDSLTNPQRMRRINEIQHRLAAFLWALLRDDPQRYPDDVLLRIVLEHPDDNELELQMCEALTRLAGKKHLPVI